MKVRNRPKEHHVVLTMAALVILSLLGIHTVLPDAFGVFVAVAGAIGALVVLYEVRLTKRIAQAEFIRDLQTGFSSDENIGALWRKLLLKEPIPVEDRALISSYLTFFETLGLLLDRGAIELKLVDDLFRNRFFTAVGNPDILRQTLISQAGAFANIHRLIADWHEHLVQKGVPVHPGYYSYIEAITVAKGYQVEAVDLADVAPVLDLQRRVRASMAGRAWLGKDLDAVLVDGSGVHAIRGVYRDGALVAAAVILDPVHYERQSAVAGPNLPDARSTAVLHAVLVDPNHRNQGLGRTLVELLERVVVEDEDWNKQQVVCRIHPKNRTGRALLTLLGYKRTNRFAVNHWFQQATYVRKLPIVGRQWAR